MKSYAAVWHISTVEVLTASSACNAGTISPPAKAWIWNLLSLASATYFEMVSDALKGTSSDLGQLVVQRHFNSGIDCAMAGAATVVDAARPMPAVFRNCRRFMALPFVFCFANADAISHRIPLVCFL